MVTNESSTKLSGLMSENFEKGSNSNVIDNDSNDRLFIELGPLLVDENSITSKNNSVSNEDSEQSLIELNPIHPQDSTFVKFISPNQNGFLQVSGQDSDSCISYKQESKDSGLEPQGQLSVIDSSLEEVIFNRELIGTDFTDGHNSIIPHVQFKSPSSKSEVPASLPIKNMSVESNRAINFTIKDNSRVEKKTRPKSSHSSDLSSGSETFDSDEHECKALDGGFGWVIVIASFFVHLIADGVTMSFGVLFVEFLVYFKESKAMTSLVGSVFMSIPLLAGPLASWLTDQYGCRKVTIIGAVIASVGFLLSALTNSILWLLLTLGLITGLGLSVCYVAAIVIVAFYFDKKRSLATGIAVAGSGIGTFLFAPLCQYFITHWGWRGCLILLAGIFLNMCICGAIMRPLGWTEKVKKKRSGYSSRTSRYGSASQSTDMLGEENQNSLNSHSHQLPPLGELRRILENGNVVPLLSPDDLNGQVPRSSSLRLLPTFLNRSQTIPEDVIPCLDSKANAFEVVSQMYPHLLSTSITENMDFLPILRSDPRNIVLSDSRLNRMNGASEYKPSRPNSFIKQESSDVSIVVTPVASPTSPTSISPLALDHSLPKSSSRQFQQTLKINGGVPQIVNGSQSSSSFKPNCIPPYLRTNSRITRCVDLVLLVFACFFVCQIILSYN